MTLTYTEPRAAETGKAAEKLADSVAPAPEITPNLAVLGRLTWMLVGPFFLLVAATSVLFKSRGLVSGSDGAYLAALIATLVGRWVEFRSGHALTAEGTPTTALQFRRYLIVATLVALAIWVVARGVRYFFVHA